MPGLNWRHTKRTFPLSIFVSEKQYITIYWHKITQKVKSSLLGGYNSPMSSSSTFHRIYEMTYSFTVAVRSGARQVALVVAAPGARLMTSSPL